MVYRYRMDSDTTPSHAKDVSSLDDTPY